jgi:hypothetical protein
VVVPPANVADTLFALVIVTVHVVAVPEQEPPQPVKVAPVSGTAVSVTDEFSVRFAVQAVEPRPQLIPLPVTLPLPLTETLSATVLPVTGPEEKLAVTLFAVSIKTVQVVAVPPQAPVQPRNVEPMAAVAVSVTVVGGVNAAEQTFAPVPQLIAPLFPLTFPLPLTVTASVGRKVAVTVRGPLIVSVHVTPVPVQPLLHPQKTNPSSGSAVSVTVEFNGSFA